MINNLLFLVLIFTLSMHDFHVTHTTLHYNKNLNSIEITIKVSIEDLEKHVKSKYSKQLRIGTIQENKSSNKIIKDYFSNHLKLLTNNKQYEYQWVGKEISNNLHDIYLYFEMPNYTKEGNPDSLTIENIIFLESDLSQTNIVLIEFDNTNYNLTFTKDHENQTIFFNK